MAQPPRAPLHAYRRLLVAAAVVALALTVAGPVANPAPVAAITAGDLEGKVMSLINAERSRRGLVPLRTRASLTDFAGDRAATMASSGVMKHPSCLSCMLTNSGIQWYSNGEVIAYTGYPTDVAAERIYNMWMGSSLHRGLIMSNKFNYLGLGMAYRSSDHKWFAAGVLTESQDVSRPWAKMGSGRRSGNDLSWSWSGSDTKLQTHTAGLKNYDVQYRVGSGDWSTIRSATTSTSITLADRAGGKSYGLRVRSRDNRGYLSSWSAEVRVSVP